MHMKMAVAGIEPETHKAIGGENGGNGHSSEQGLI